MTTLIQKIESISLIALLWFAGYFAINFNAFNAVYATKAAEIQKQYEFRQKSHFGNADSWKQEQKIGALPVTAHVVSRIGASLTDLKDKVEQKGWMIAYVQSNMDHVNEMKKKIAARKDDEKMTAMADQIQAEEDTAAGKAVVVIDTSTLTGKLSQSFQEYNHAADRAQLWQQKRELLAYQQSKGIASVPDLSSSYDNGNPYGNTLAGQSYNATSFLMNSMMENAGVDL